MANTSAIECPRCHATMVERRARATGEAFLGCSRFPECRGTRRLAPGPTRSGPRRRPTQYRLSLGGRYAKDVPEAAELLVARAVGRNLTRREGCLVQGLALIGLVVVAYLFFASGLFLGIVTAVSDWYAHQIKLPGAPTPSPGPGSTSIRIVIGLA